MGSSWVQINPRCVPQDVEILFVKYSSGSSGYSVQLTDFQFLWAESLDRRQLFNRAWDLTSPIDPSEGPSQMQLLMKRIRAGLHGQADSTLTIDFTDDSRQYVHMRVLSPLPPGFKPLQWQLELHRCPQNALTISLFHPCFTMINLLNGQVQSLLQTLKEKDLAISKLLDKVQIDPIGLSNNMFGSSKQRPGSSGRSKERGFGPFPGLIPFDESQWSEQQRKTLSGDAVRSWDIAPALALLDPDQPLDSDGDMQEKPISRVHEHHSPSTAKLEPTEGVSYSVSVEPTSDNYGNNYKESTETVNGASTTEGSDDEDVKSTVTKPVAEKATASGTPKKHHSHKAGEDKQTVHRERTRSVSSDETTSTMASPGIEEHTKSTELAIRNQFPMTHLEGKSPDSKRLNMPPKSTKAKLGKIGGRQAQELNTNAGSNDATNPHQLSKGSSVQEVISPRKALDSSSKEIPKPPTETSKDIANRKREQLRQNLEAANTTSRKKRKF